MSGSFGSDYAGKLLPVPAVDTESAETQSARSPERPSRHGDVRAAVPSEARRAITAAIAAMAVQEGFLTADAVALDTVAQYAEMLFADVALRSRDLCEHAGGGSIVHVDVLAAIAQRSARHPYALAEYIHQQPSTSADQPTSTAGGADPTMAFQFQGTYGLPSDDPRVLPGAPQWLPPLPPEHTYKQTYAIELPNCDDVYARRLRNYEIKALQATHQRFKNALQSASKDSVPCDPWGKPLTAGVKARGDDDGEMVTLPHCYADDAKNAPCLLRTGASSSVESRCLVRAADTPRSLAEIVADPTTRLLKRLKDCGEQATSAYHKRPRNHDTSVGDDGALGVERL